MAKPTKEKTVVTYADAKAEGITEATFTRRWKILAVLCLSLMTVMISNMSLNMALPKLSADLELTQLQLTWAVEAYSLVFAGLLFIASAVADRYGRMRVMQIGLGIYMVASLYAAFVAGTGAELIAARVLMGVGGAFVMPTTLSIVNVVFPSIERPRAIAIWSAVSGVGMMFGSVVTGTLLEFFPWESVFIFTGTLAVIAFSTNMRLIPESRDEHQNPVDWFGGALVTVGLIGVVYAIMEAPSEGITTPAVLAALIGGLLALAGFVAQQFRSKSPLLDMHLFKRPAFGLSALSVTLTFFAMMGAFFGMSQVFQLVMEWGTFKSAIAFFPVMLPMMILGPQVPKIVARFGTKATVAPGLLFVSAGFFYMSHWPTIPQYWHFLVGMGTVIIGMALVMTPATNMMMAAVPKNRSGMGSAMNDTTRELGGALGIAVLGSMVSSGFSRNVADATLALPSGVQDVAGRSLGTALAVAKDLGPAGGDFAYAAKEAFMTGNEAAMSVSAMIALGAAVLIALLLPNREAAVVEDVAHDPDFIDDEDAVDEDAVAVS